MRRYFKHKVLYTISLILIAGLVIYFIFIYPQQQIYYSRHVSIQGVYLLKPIPLQNFELIDNHGKKFTKNNLKNHWSFLFFGFTHCEMVCPVTLSSLSKFYQTVASKIPNDKIPQVVFVTIDPERDTISRLNDYVTQFNEKFIAARTTLKKTSELETQFHIITKKISTRNQKYTYDHSTEILLINPKAEIQAYFQYPANPRGLEKDYLAILAKYG